MLTFSEKNWNANGDGVEDELEKNVQNIPKRIKKKRNSQKKINGKFVWLIFVSNLTNPILCNSISVQQDFTVFSVC